MERELSLELVRVTEAAALAVAPWLGRGDGEAADRAAVEAMRAVLATVELDGRVVAGEGERDGAPRFLRDEPVGCGGGPRVDLVVDPLDGTRLVAHGLPGAMAVLAVAPRGCLAPVPDVYMEKLAVGPRAAGHVDLERPIEDNLRAVAGALGKGVQELTVALLDRPRHAPLAQRIRQAGARLRLIPDADVAAAIATALEETGIDMMVGIGGAPEGLLAAAALLCLGGELQGRFAGAREADRRQLQAAGMEPHRVLQAHQLVRGDQVLFVATGVTDSLLLRGVRCTREGGRTHSLVMDRRTGTVRWIEGWHRSGHRHGRAGPGPGRRAPAAGG